jgi:hypothetical protein
MENSFKFLLIAIAAIVISILATFTIVLLRNGSDQATSSTSNVGEVSKEFSQPKLRSFDGLTVNGSDVSDCISDAVSSGQFSVLVHTGEGGNILYLKDRSIAKTTKVIYKNEKEELLSDLAGSTSVYSGICSLTSPFQSNGLGSSYSCFIMPYSYTEAPTTVLNTRGQTTTSSGLKLCEDERNFNYINPFGSFTGKVFSGASEKIVLIEFTQEVNK